MPYELKSEKDGRGVIITWAGIVTAGEISAINEYIYAENRLPILRYQIWDFSKATKEIKPNVSHVDIRYFAMQDGRAVAQNPKMVLALVGSRNFFMGSQDVYKVFTEVWAGDLRCEVFSTMKAAREWIAGEFPELGD
jgi:hypothetical protein